MSSNMLQMLYLDLRLMLKKIDLELDFVRKHYQPAINNSTFWSYPPLCYLGKREPDKVILGFISPEWNEWSDVVNVDSALPPIFRFDRQQFQQLNHLIIEWSRFGCPLSQFNFARRTTNSMLGSIYCDPSEGLQSLDSCSVYTASLLPMFPKPLNQSVTLPSPAIATLGIVPSHSPVPDDTINSEHSDTAHTEPDVLSSSLLDHNFAADIRYAQSNNARCYQHGCAQFRYRPEFPTHIRWTDLSGRHCKFRFPFSVQDVPA